MAGAGSKAPVLTLPAWMQTMVGPSSAGSFAILAAVLYFRLRAEGVVMPAWLENLRPQRGDPGVVIGNPLIEEIAARVVAPDPVRCCDDPEAWDWRDYLKLRKTSSKQIAMP